MQKDPARRRFPLADRVVEVIDDTLTGEVLLDEALKLMKSSEKMGVSAWIDLLSGEQASPRLFLLYPPVFENRELTPLGCTPPPPRQARRGT